MPTGPEAARGGITNVSIKRGGAGGVRGGILPSRLNELLFNDQYLKEYLEYQPIATTAVQTAGAAAHGAPTGATGDANILHLRSGVRLRYIVQGAGQTLLAPTWDMTNGALLAGLDAAASEGVEYVVGDAVTAKNPFAHVVGTSPPAFVRAKLKVGTVANSAELAVGFRKAEAFQAAIDDYDEMAVLNMQAGDIKRETILNNGAAVTVDTALNWANAATHELEVRVIGRKVLFYVDGVLAASGALFQFDAGEVVIPFVKWLQGAGGGSTLHLLELEAGPLYVVGKDPNRR